MGGRTGWVAVVAGALFFPFMFFSPLIGMVPPQATGVILVIVGWLMATALVDVETDAEPDVERRIPAIDFHNFAIGLSSLLAIIIMPLTFSITNGIAFGFISYVVIRAAQGDWRQVHPLMYAAAGAFTLFFLIPLLHDHLSWV